MKTYLNIVINYSNEEEVIEYAKQLVSQTISDKLNLVVVNNKKSEQLNFNFEEELDKLDIATFIFTPSNNLGYLGGALYGYQHFIKGKIDLPKWVLISNTDIIINDKDFFEKFLFEKYSEDTWCIAPSVYNLKNKTYDNPKYVNRIPLKKMNRSIFIHERPILSLLYLTLGKYKAKKNKKLKKCSQYTYAIQGCFFALKSEFIELIKNYGYEGFLYGEENYIAELIRKNGKKCYSNNNIEIIHNEKMSTKLLNYKKRARYYAKSHRYLRDEFYINDND